MIPSKQRIELTVSLVKDLLLFNYDKAINTKLNRTYARVLPLVRKGNVECVNSMPWFVWKKSRYILETIHQRIIQLLIVEGLRQKII